MAAFLCSKLPKNGIPLYRLMGWREKLATNDKSIVKTRMDRTFLRRTSGMRSPLNTASLSVSRALIHPSFQPIVPFPVRLPEFAKVRSRSATCRSPQLDQGWRNPRRDGTAKNCLHSEAIDQGSAICKQRFAIAFAVERCWLPWQQKVDWLKSRHIQKVCLLFSSIQLKSGSVMLTDMDLATRLKPY